MKYGITGLPLGHSLSPLLHNWALARCGMPGRYDPYETTPEQLPGFVDFVRQTPLAGVSVTVPHKVAIMELIDGVSARAARAGAVNTLYWDGLRLLGENTDVLGFVHSLSRSLEKYRQTPASQGLQAPLPDHVLILGAGGAARGVLCGLAELTEAAGYGGTGESSVRPRMGVALAARNAEALERLFADFPLNRIPWPERTDYLRDARPDLVINTTPLGMSGAFAGQSPIPASAWPDARQPERERERKTPETAFDLVYNPLRTPFLRDAAAAGWNTVTGLEFFAAQGAGQFKIWTGHTLLLPEIITLLSKALRKKARKANLL